MFEFIETEISEIIHKDPYKYCIMGIHKSSDNNIYTIFVRNDIITEDGYIKDSSEYEACRISLLKPEYVLENYNTIPSLEFQEKELFNDYMKNNWDYIKSMSDYELGECPNYLNL